MNRILLEPESVTPDGIARLDARQTAHVRDVLRAQPGATLRIGVIDGPRGTGVLMADPGTDTLRIRCRLDEPPLPPTRVHLLLALPRPKVLKRLWPLLTAAGFGRVVLVNAAKVERCYFDTHWLDATVYRPRLVEGLEQSGDTRLPAITVRRRFKPFVEDELATLFPEAARVVAHPGTGPRLRDTVPADARAIVTAIGPEGGWTDYELALLEAQGFNRIALGPRIMRSDHAVCAIAALAHDHLQPEAERDSQGLPLSR